MCFTLGPGYPWRVFISFPFGPVGPSEPLSWRPKLSASHWRRRCWLQIPKLPFLRNNILKCNTCMLTMQTGNKVHVHIFNKHIRRLHLLQNKRWQDGMSHQLQPLGRCSQALNRLEPGIDLRSASWYGTNLCSCSVPLPRVGLLLRPPSLASSGWTNATVEIFWSSTSCAKNNMNKFRSILFHVYKLFG